ncbi:bifunctional 4-hydroxy-2-oxoglutarate aldolase/2-dehydro-3-deoxy-phosphogluconate aldolase [Labedella populi]|uniref:bifunctional 4-hydroxy-2-oxoglutarate aldolase/2-dehydro-3-deoxy-phosphogluconate aldolase n=1 Tax=Labedella populi TaxID=2498850 RepID=UPI001FB6324A|nr:bifunctional 4-hydroxy-2-oxoglutarate aldolase/2-dehydro-3-deoxy-phosphogluconate aldolase [Labedella populi]
MPLASIGDPDHIDAIGDGLTAGGLPVVEVALRGAHGMPAVKRLAARGDLHVGAGTVLSVDLARRALDAGATFVVTPGLDPEVVGYVSDAGFPVIPGVLTPTEVQAAMALGLDRLKLFPAGVFDGLALLDAYGDVYRGVRFMPSGGVRPQNLAAHLAHPAVFAVSGSWITAAAPQGAGAVASAVRAALGIADGRNAA